MVGRGNSSLFLLLSYVKGCMGEGEAGCCLMLKGLTGDVEGVGGGGLSWVEERVWQLGVSYLV